MLPFLIILEYIGVLMFESTASKFWHQGTIIFACQWYFYSFSLWQNCLSLITSPIMTFINFQCLLRIMSKLATENFWEGFKFWNSHALQLWAPCFQKWVIVHRITWHHFLIIESQVMTVLKYIWCFNILPVSFDIKVLLSLLVNSKVEFLGRI